MTADTTSSLTARDLSERQIAIIEFEGSWWMQDDARDTAIRARFACSTEEYYQELNQLLDLPGALEVDPLVVLVGPADRADRPDRAASNSATNSSTAARANSGVYR